MAAGEPSRVHVDVVTERMTPMGGPGASLNSQGMNQDEGLMMTPCATATGGVSPNGANAHKSAVRTMDSLLAAVRSAHAVDGSGERVVEVD